MNQTQSIEVHPEHLAQWLFPWQPLDTLRQCGKLVRQNDTHTGSLKVPDSADKNRPTITKLSEGGLHWDCLLGR